MPDTDGYPGAVPSSLTVVTADIAAEAQQRMRAQLTRLRPQSGTAGTAEEAAPA